MYMRQSSATTSEVATEDGGVGGGFGGQHVRHSTYKIRTMMVYVKVHGVRIDSKIRIKREAMFWLSIHYPYLCPNSKL